MRLNLGSGRSELSLSDYTNVDRREGGEIYPVKLNDGTIPEPGTIDEIRCSHAVEHLNHADARHAIVTWARLLKPGGILKIAVPDLKWIAEKYLAGEKLPIASYIMGGQQDAEDYHRTVFDEEDLRACMEMAGLTDIKPWVSELNDCAALPVSLNLQGTRRGYVPPAPHELPKIAAVMSMPRLAFSENMFCCLQIAIARNMSFEKVTGAFYGQCMERIMTPHVENGTAEWVVCFDYDSLISVQQFDQLCSIMLAHPEVDALAPLQVKRDENALLMGLLDDNGNQYPPTTKITTKHFEPDVIRASWAHFGATIIRVSALRKMPHPWFYERTNAEGKWDDGRLDSDLGFWENFAKSGNKLYLAPHVAIGHAQLLGTFLDQDLKPRHAYLGEYLKNGAPEWARR